jgi:hypothetical protein
MGKNRNKKRSNKTNKTVQLSSMKPVHKRIGVTDEFNNFVDELQIRFKEQGIQDFIRKSDDLVSTICSRMRVNEHHTTDSFSVITDDFFLKLSPLKGGIHLHLLVVNPMSREKGIGGGVLKTIRKVSNELEIPVYLIPIPLQGHNVNYEVLQSLYHNHGYRREKISRYWVYEPNFIPEDVSGYYSSVS